MKKMIIVFCGIFCVIFTIATNTCCAKVKNSPVIIGCSLSANEAAKADRMLFAKSIPARQYILTTIGIEIAGEGIVTNTNDSKLLRDVVPVIRASCTSSNEESEMNMYSNDYLPRLVCPKGDGMRIIFESPNDPDTKKYIYRATMTTFTDEDMIDAQKTNSDEKIKNEQLQRLKQKEELLKAKIIDEVNSLELALDNLVNINKKLEEKELKKDLISKSIRNDSSTIIQQGQSSGGFGSW